METQLKYVTKEELHKMIDEMPEEKLMVLTYKKDIGISDNGKMLKKKKTKKLVDKATLLIMTESNPIRKVDLEGDFGLFKTINRENIIKTILFIILSLLICVSVSPKSIESCLRPFSVVLCIIQCVGIYSFFKVLVKDIPNTVGQYLLPVLFCMITYGWMPDCSDPILLFEKSA